MCVASLYHLAIKTFHTFSLHAYNRVLRMLYMACLSHRSISIISWMYLVHSPSYCGMTSAIACLGKQMLNGGKKAKQEHAAKSSTRA